MELSGNRLGKTTEGNGQGPGWGELLWNSVSVFYLKFQRLVKKTSSELASGELQGKKKRKRKKSGTIYVMSSVKVERLLAFSYDLARAEFAELCSLLK